jgi:hypothetical protein
MKTNEDVMARFDSGANRTSDRGKLDYEGFLSSLALKRYAEYMHKHRSTPDGDFRESDNWQLGIPIKNYAKSLWRHFMDAWGFYRGWDWEHDADYIEEALCAIMFNAMGWLHEVLKAKKEAYRSAVGPQPPPATSQPPRGPSLPPSGEGSDTKSDIVESQKTWVGRETIPRH